MSTRFRELDAAKILDTIAALETRVGERFPESGLRQLCVALLAIGRDASARAAAIAEPNWPLRVLVGLLIAAILVIVISAVATLHLSTTFSDFGSFAQAVDAGVNDIVLLSLGIFFLVGIERRIKRRRVLHALHELRSLAHIADMHQLTKDPEGFAAGTTGADRPMTRLDLARYLDYVTELLSLVSKIAALYVQRFDDEVAMDAVNDIESLTTGLSRKIWQKITLLDMPAPRAT